MASTWYVNKSGFDATYIFVVSGISVTPLAGATYTNNSKTFTVLGCKITGGSGNIFCTGTGAPSASGVLTRASGTGDNSITFSALASTGTTPALAKLTIQAGIGLMATGDTLVVGAGIYYERISMVANTTIEADGIVVLDGTGISGSGSAITISTGTATYYTIRKKSTGGRWVIQNHTVNSDIVGAIKHPSGAGTISNISDCLIIGNANNTCGYSISAVGNQTLYGFISNCVFFGFVNGMYSSSTVGLYPGNMNVSVCTFYNCTTAFNQTCTGYIPQSQNRNNIFHTCTTAIAETVARPATYNYNTYYNCTNLYNNNGTLITTLADMRTAGMEANGSTTDPQLADPANLVFFPKAAVANTAGAYPYSLANYGASNDSDGKWHITASADNSGWYNASGNITKNGTTGYFELSAGTSDTIASPVWNLGSNRSIQKISIAANEAMPTNVVDTDITDSAPNYLTVEMRCLLNTFAQDAESPAWVIVPRESTNTTLGQYSYNGQYLQVRLTLRTDGVPA